MKQSLSWRLYRRFLKIFLLVACMGVAFCSVNVWCDLVPSAIHVRQGEKEEFDLKLPCMATIGDRNVNLAKPFTIASNKMGSRKMQVKLFGLIPLKQLEVKTVPEQKVIPGGEMVGVYVETDGIMVLGTSPVQSCTGQVKEPAKNLILAGDYIVGVNGKKINYKSEFLNFIQENKTKPIVISVRRKDKIMKVRVTPVKVRDKKYQCGIWIRDDMQGIGTLTYLKKDGTFGALGHGVSDVDMGKLLESKKGRIYRSNIIYVIPSKNGKPGEVVGSIDYADSYRLGSVLYNTSWGIFGTGEQSLFEYTGGEEMPIGLKQEVHTGKAKLVSAVSGHKEEYEIEILKCNLSDRDNKGMTIQITDERLLQLTGGIVQGMSGSPIIQDGKVIGAVTHVFVNHPQKGYAGFIENML